MFVLTKLNNDKEKIIFLPSKGQYTIGRLSTDVIIAEDLSISRTHVRICVSNAGSLIVEDLDSRYGTYINSDIERNKKMVAKTPTPVKIDDKIRFGALNSVWKLSQLKLITTASALNLKEIEELSHLLKPLGGTLVASWTDECSHLTMETVTVTVKLLHALLDNKPIVRVDYWRQLLMLARRIHIPGNWPNPEDFVPAQPADMPSIKWLPERTKVFAGKTFVFLNRRHLDMYGPVVQKAGGTCKDLNSGVRKQFLIKENVVVIQYISSTQSQGTETIFNIQNILEQAGLRAVPDYEIGLAILHCSLDKFCNPSYKMTENSLATTESMNSSILVPNTERTQTEGNANKASEFVVAESQKSELFAESVDSEKRKSEPRTESAPKPDQRSKNVLSKRKNNPIYLDSSSDEDVAVMDEPIMKSKPLKETSKRKMQDVIASADEDKPADARHLQKKAKILSLRKAGAKTSTAEVAHGTVDGEVLGDFEQVDPSKPKPTTPQKEESGFISTRRSTRSCAQQNAQIEPEKPPTPTYSPRRSLRGKQAKQNAPLAIVQSDSDDEQGLFQFSSESSAPAGHATVRSAQENVESNNTKAENTMPSSDINKSLRNTGRSFLGKTQSQASNQSVAQAASQSRKRVRLQQIQEIDSDDNENLFQFCNVKKRRQSGFGRAGNESSDENMFNFKSKDQPQQNKEANNNEQDSKCTLSIMPENKAKSKYFVPKAGIQPHKANGSGWLSCSRLHEEVKLEPKPEIDRVEKIDEVAIKEENELDTEKLEHLKWLASIKDNIQVRMCNMSISVRKLDETDTATKSVSPVNGCKNFKKFRKGNVRSQQHVVGLKRMQLAEGMVSNL